MSNSILQTYLNNQFIKTADEEAFANLEKAVIVVEKSLIKKKTKIIAYSLVAIDPQISEDDPVIVEVEKIIVTKWKTFKNSVSQTKDKSTTYIRAVILQALVKLAKETQYAGIIWHSTRNIISFYQTDTEKSELGSLIQNVGDSVEIGGQKIWSIRNNTNQIEFAKTELNLGNLKSVQVNTEEFINRIRDATVHTGWKLQAEGHGNNPSYPHQRDQTWSLFFAKDLGKGISEEINKTLSSQTKVINSLSSKLQTELDNYFANLQPFFEQVSQTISNSMVANNKRSELIWWKQSLYSRSVKKSYRELDEISSVVVMAFDLAEMVNPIYPVSVDFLLKETLRDVYGEGINKSILITEIRAKIGETEIGVKNLLSDLVNEKEGRKSLGSTLANINLLEPSIEISKETGIDKKASISLADFALWLFHDYQALKLANTK